MFQPPQSTYSVYHTTDVFQPPQSTSQGHLGHKLVKQLSHSLLPRSTILQERVEHIVGLARVRHRMKLVHIPPVPYSLTAAHFSFVKVTALGVLCFFALLFVWRCFLPSASLINILHVHVVWPCLLLSSFLLHLSLKHVLLLLHLYMYY